MKIVILNASPRWHGNISQMLNVVRETAESRGAEVTMVEVNHLHVHPCIACMRCRTSGQCVLNPDDAQRILRIVNESDALVIGAPCYWGNIPGQLKLLFDRMVYGLMAETDYAYPVPLQKGKKCILFSTSSTPWPFNILLHQSHGAIRAMKEICKYSGFKIVATVEKGKTRDNHMLSSREVSKCQRAALKLLA